MNKRIVWWVAAMVFLAVLLAGVGSVMIAKAKRFGKDQYYVQITQTATSDGSPSWPYVYEQQAFDEKGRKTALHFRAEKSLRLQAYLRVYVGSGNSVTSWEEVEAREVPESAKEQLQQLALKSSAKE